MFLKKELKWQLRVSRAIEQAISECPSTKQLLRLGRWSEICAMGIVASFRDLYTDICNSLKNYLNKTTSSLSILFRN